MNLLSILFVLCLSGALASVEPCTWDNVQIGGGGYVTQIAIHPTVADRIVVCTDIGGALRWDESSGRWRQLLHGLAVEGAGNLYGADGLALDPVNDQRIFLALGMYAAFSPTGVYRSRDGGVTWERVLDAVYSSNTSTRGEDRVAGECLLVDPRNPQVVYAATRTTGLWRSVQGGDAGTWTRLASVPAGDVGDPANYWNSPPRGVRAVAVDTRTTIAGRSAVVYVGLPGVGIHRSVDGGDTFTALTGAPTDVRRLVVDTEGRLYVTWGVINGTGGLTRYENGAWTTLTLPENYPVNAIAVDPTNSSRLLVASHNWWLGIPFWRSTDRGATWQPIGHGYSTRQPDVPWWPAVWFSSAPAALAFDPHHPGRAYMTDWYAIWRTDDVFATPVTWSTREVGHEQIVPLTLATPPGGAVSLYTGAADVRMLRHTAINAFPTRPTSGLADNLNEGTSVDVTEQDPSKVAMVSSAQWAGGPTSLHTSDDFGQTWTLRASMPEAPGRIACAAASPANLVYVGDKVAPRFSRDRGVTWNAASGAPATAVTLEYGSGIFSTEQPLVADRVQDGTFYLFADGIIHRSTDGGATWSPRGSLAGGGRPHLLALPGSTGELWLSREATGLWRSVDGGLTLTRQTFFAKAQHVAVGAPLPNRTTPTLYVLGTSASGGGLGMYRSHDLGGSWSRLANENMSFGFHTMVMAADRQVYGRVYLATNGLGVILGLAPARGDVNSDGRIDDADQAALLAHFGREVTSAGWDASCDLNGDNRVDALDLQLLVQSH